MASITTLVKTVYVLVGLNIPDCSMMMRFLHGDILSWVNLLVVGSKLTMIGIILRAFTCMLFQVPIG